VDLDRPPDIVVIAGGAPIDRARAAAVPAGARVVAADAGVERARSLGWSVDVAVGDFDSLDRSLVGRLDDVAGEVRRFPRDKDATDLELALEVAAEWAPARVLVAGVEGGRPDHALANLLVASADRFAAIDVELLLEGGRAWVVRDRLEGPLPAGSIVSLVAVHGPATVSVEGVRWPLDRDLLDPGSTRGVSNRATGGPFALTVHDGTVLSIVPRPTESPR
jgi:thiamine pyrophosphokinase